MIADAADTVFTLNADDRSVQVSIYGLGALDPQSVPPEMPEREVAAHGEVAVELAERVPVRPHVAVGVGLPGMPDGVPGSFPGRGRHQLQPVHGVPGQGECDDGRHDLSPLCAASRPARCSKRRTSGLVCGSVIPRRIRQLGYAAGRPPGP